jgi:hypothetical protein
MMHITTKCTVPPIATQGIRNCGPCYGVTTDRLGMRMASEQKSLQMPFMNALPIIIRVMLGVRYPASCVDFSTCNSLPSSSSVFQLWCVINAYGAVHLCFLNTFAIRLLFVYIELVAGVRASSHSVSDPSVHRDACRLWIARRRRGDPAAPEAPVLRSIRDVVQDGLSVQSLGSV